MTSYPVCRQAPRGPDGPPAPTAEAAHRLAGRDRGPNQANGGPTFGAGPGGRQAPGGGTQGRQPNARPGTLMSTTTSGFNAAALTPFLDLNLIFRSRHFSYILVHLLRHTHTM